MSARAILHLVYNDIARRLIMRQAEENVARDLGFSLGYLQRVLRRPEFKQILEDVRHAIYNPLDTKLQASTLSLRDRIEAAAEESYRRLTFLMNNAMSEQVQLHAAQDVMDRAGIVRKTEVDMKIVHFNEIDATKILEALKKAQEGKALLGSKTPDQLAKAPDELAQHPIIQHKATYGSNEQSK